MLYEIVHKTSYAYRTDVSRSFHAARLTPRVRPNQRCLQHTVSSNPGAAQISTRLDYFGNTATFLTVEGAHRDLVVFARSVVELLSSASLPPNALEPWEEIRDACLGNPRPDTLEASEFLYRSALIPLGDDFSAYAKLSFLAERPILEALGDLNQRIFSDFTFDPSATSVATPLEQVVKNKRGVCQDFAHFQIACLRSIGIPARYVSGYLETQPPPGQPKLVGSDASHAWTQAWCGPHGWIDVDPTNNLFPHERHITVGWGRDYEDVCPLRGVITGGGEHRLTVAVDVVPLKTPPSCKN